MYSCFVYITLSLPFSPRNKDESNRRTGEVNGDKLTKHWLQPSFSLCNGEIVCSSWVVIVES